MKKIKKLFAILLVMVLAAQPVYASPVSSIKQPASKSEINILMIGNSYTFRNHMPVMVKKLCRSAGKKVNVTSVTRSGASLNQLISESTVEGRRVRKLLSNQTWDYVILQECHYYPISNPDKMLEAVLTLKPLIRKAHAKMCLYMTWAPSNGHPDYVTYSKYVKSRKEYQSKVTSVYKKIAAETGAILIPAGKVMMEAQGEDTGISLIMKDKSHPTGAGSYLIASTIVYTLFPKLPEPRYTWKLSSSKAATLRAIVRNSSK